MTAAPAAAPARGPGDTSAFPRVRRAREAAERLSAAVAERDFAGWDPYDALTSPVVGAIARRPLARRIAIQLLKRSPVNLRPLLRVRRLHHTKGLALFASGHARLAALAETAWARAHAVALADRLLARAIPAREGVGWGYDFPVQVRWGAYEPGHPNAVGTGFAAHALLDVAELTGEERFVAGARSAVAFACSELPVSDGDERLFGYYPGARAPIHNASLMLASACARVLREGDPGWEVARDAVAYSLARQRPDGSWPYGEGPGLEWVDGFHTAYNLEALARWHSVTGDPAASAGVERGLAFYVERLIDPDGAARATVGARHPVDIHACATAVTTLAVLSDHGYPGLDAARRVLDWTLDHMRRRDGRFAFQRHRWHRNSVPYVRWSDGHMLLALGSYLRAEERHG